MRPKTMTILKKYALFAVLLALGYTHKVAQTAQKLDLPSILPPSPAIQNFMRYGEYRMTIARGIQYKHSLVHRISYYARSTWPRRKDQS